jgi:hypothetical protein
VTCEEGKKIICREIVRIVAANGGEMVYRDLEKALDRSPIVRRVLFEMSMTRRPSDSPDPQPADEIMRSNRRWAEWTEEQNALTVRDNDEAPQ